MSLLYQPLIPSPLDNFATPTSEEQVEVEESIRAFIDAYQSKVPRKGKRVADHEVPLPSLSKDLHCAFTRRVLEPLPSNYLGFDSTRCWLIYWVAQSHALMGRELDERIRSQAIATFVHFQNAHTGGFGGGNGQIGHLMGTYASLMGLALVGGPGECPDEDDVALGVSTSIGKGGWDAIDRVKMYNFLLSLKQPDGSFTVHRDGEIDVRASYCVVCIALILGIATPELLQGMGKAIASCQTYEGGLSAASQPFAASGSSEMGAATLGEAHGGYAYCAMAAHLSLSLLPDPLEPNQSPLEAGGQSGTWRQKDSASDAHLDLDGVIRWAAQQQGIPIEGGGFRGRTNKLVDGCYGWFTGAGLGTVLAAQVELAEGQWWHSDGEEGETDDDWESVENAPIGTGSTNAFDDGLLFDREALQEYILAIAQAPRGGLRDKPGKNADVYHTCYNLSGLSLCQHRVQLNKDVRQSIARRWKPIAGAQDDGWRKSCYLAMLSWTIDPKFTCILGGAENRLGVTHPIFNIPLGKARMMMQWAYAQ